MGTVEFNVMVKTNDVVRGAAPEDAGVIVVKMVVINSETFELPVGEADRDVAVLLIAAEFCETVDDCAEASRPAHSHGRKCPSRI